METIFSNDSCKVYNVDYPEVWKQSHIFVHVLSERGVLVSAVAAVSSGLSSTLGPSSTIDPRVQVLTIILSETDAYHNAELYDHSWSS